MTRTFIGKNIRVVEVGHTLKDFISVDDCHELIEELFEKLEELRAYKARHEELLKSWTAEATRITEKQHTPDMVLRPKDCDGKYYKFYDHTEQQEKSNLNSSIDWDAVRRENRQWIIDTIANATPEEKQKMFQGVYTVIEPYLMKG